MNLPVKTKTSFSQLLTLVRDDFSGISFKASDMFRWSDESRTIYYDAHSEFAVWSLLHELGHMQRGHSVYNSDATLIRMELEAWESAKVLGRAYGVSINEDHIQDCMDSYRSWQHKRSSCPVCNLTGVEKHDGVYHCINCRSDWKVGSDRFCRVYRRKK